MSRLAAYASFVKLEHTVFSLPVLFAGVLLHARTWPGWRLMLLVLAAAAAGRVMAMGLNRLIDAEIDARNPRTKGRELPRGAMRRGEAWAIVLAACAVYLASASAIAPVCLWLSPVPVALFVLYPYLKRFTAFAHAGLGLAWSMGPLGAWLAASQSLEQIGEAGWLWLFSFLWVTGFDVIYATMDEAFDRAAGLHSLPVALGKDRALMAAKGVHFGAFAALAALCWQLQSGAAVPWLAMIGGLFVWQHAVADRRPEFAFFQLNAATGFLVLALVGAGVTFP